MWKNIKTATGSKKLPCRTSTPKVDSHHFELLLGCEFLKPKKHNMEAITKWVAIAIYTAAM